MGERNKALFPVTLSFNDQLNLILSNICTTVKERFKHKNREQTSTMQTVEASIEQAA